MILTMKGTPITTEILRGAIENCENTSDLEVVDGAIEFLVDDVELGIELALIEAEAMHLAVRSLTYRTLFKDSTEN